MGRAQTFHPRHINIVTEILSVRMKNPKRNARAGLHNCCEDKHVLLTKCVVKMAGYYMADSARAQDEANPVF